MNDIGTVLGFARKYIDGNFLGSRAVRWDGDSITATELDNPWKEGIEYKGVTTYDISDINTAVGSASEYIENRHREDPRAVIWGPDGLVVDLDTLIDPASGWTLTDAYDISDNGAWVVGSGMYGPDGDGPLEAYERAWMLQAPHLPTLPYRWGSPQGGHFDIGENWIAGTEPGVTDAATFDLSGAPYIVTFQQNHTTLGLTVSDGDVTFDLVDGTGGPGHVYEVTEGVQIDGGRLVVRGGTLRSLTTVDVTGGELLVNGGGNVANVDGFVGDAAGAPGSASLVTVSGDGSTWTNSGDLQVGVSGVGTVVIANGGALSVSGDITFGVGADAEGTFEMSGGAVSAVNLSVGDAGKGVFNQIGTDSRVDIAGALRLGQSSTGEGESDNVGP